VKIRLGDVLSKHLLGFELPLAKQTGDFAGGRKGGDIGKVVGRWSGRLRLAVPIAVLTILTMVLFASESGLEGCPGFSSDCLLFHLLMLFATWR
jgi:hypothetical protein